MKNSQIRKQARRKVALAARKTNLAQYVKQNPKDDLLKLELGARIEKTKNEIGFGTSQKYHWDASEKDGRA